MARTRITGALGAHRVTGARCLLADADLNMLWDQEQALATATTIDRLHVLDDHSSNAWRGLGVRAHLHGWRSHGPTALAVPKRRLDAAARTYRVRT